MHRILALALSATLFAPASLTAGELPEDWRTLTAAAAKLHYQDHVLSKTRRTQATEPCYALKKSKDSAVRAAAEALSPHLQEVLSLEFARLKSGLAPRDQAGSRDQAIVELFLGTKDYLGVVKDGVGAATRFARANDRLLDLEAQRVAVWQEHIRPQIEKFAGPETKVASTLEVKFGILSRDVWISVRNLSSKELHNGTFATVTHQTDKPDLFGVWFIPRLKPDETIVVEPYHSWALPRRLGDEFAVQPSLSLDFTFWSDECRTAEAKAESVNGYTIRDPFTRNLVAAGRTYRSVGSAEPKRLIFQSVKASEGRGRVGGTVTFKVETEGGQDESFTGTWEEDRVGYRGFHPGTLQIMSRPVGARSGFNQAAGKSLYWIDGRFSLIGQFGSGDDFAPVESR